MKVTQVLQAYELDWRLRSYALSNIKRITLKDCRSFRNMRTNYFQRPMDNDLRCSNDSSRTATDRQGAIDNESNCRFVS